MRYTPLVLVCLIHTFLCFVQCWYACLACFVPLVWLSLLFCIFLHLPTCSCRSLCVVLTPIQWNYGQLIQTYICPPQTPSFCLITCLFALSYASHVCLPLFGIFSQLVFSMLFPSIFFFACTHMERGRLEQGYDVLGARKRAIMPVRRCMPTKGLFSRLGSLALLERFSIYLSL